MNRWGMEIPELLPTGGTLEFLPVATDVDQPFQAITYHVFQHPLFVIRNSSVPLLSLSDGVSFDANRQPNNVSFEVLVEARDTGYPSLSAWLYVDIVVTAVRVVGPPSGRCFVGIPCGLVWRGAGGGRVPWSMSFLAQLHLVTPTVSPGPLQTNQTLTLLSRTPSQPGRYSAFGGTPVSGTMGTSGNVTLAWVAPGTQALGLYTLEVVQDPLVASRFQSRNTSSLWELTVPYTYLVQPNGTCVFDSSAGCGTGIQLRSVVCVNQSGTSLTSDGVWPPLDRLPVIPDRWVHGCVWRDTSVWA
jgi:hypothetical protein